MSPISAVKYTITCLAFLLLAGIAPTTNAAYAAQTVEWTNLVPTLPPLPNPMDRLTQDQRFDIENIIWARGLPAAARDLPENRQAVEDAVKREAEFKAAGISVDKLLLDIQAFEQEIEKRQQKVNPKLEGKNIKLAGYLLPVEYSEQGQTDFLLVPTVGACVHVPPPPPNQIIYVRLAKKLIVKDMYTPVWITGALKTRLTSKKLNIVDGVRKVTIGYHIEGAISEPYTQ